MAENPFDKYNEEPEFMLPEQSEAQSMDRIRTRIAKSSSRSSNRSFWLLMLAAAILIFLLAVILVWPRPESNVQMANSFFEAYPNYETNHIRGNNLRKVAAYEAYDKGEYKTTLDELNASKDLTDNDLLYKGIAEQAEGKWTESLVTFGRVGPSLKPEYRDVVDWYYALSLLHENKKEEAAQKLSKLDKEEGFFGKKAKDLLVKMK